MDFKIATLHFLTQSIFGMVSENIMSFAYDLAVTGGGGRGPSEGLVLREFRRHLLWYRNLSVQ